MMKRNLQRGLPILVVLTFALLGCRCGKTDPPSKPLDAQKINPYQGTIEALLAPEIYFEKGYDYWLEKKTKVEIAGATEALKIRYSDIKGNFNSTSPVEIELIVANFPSAEAARTYFRATALSGAKEDNASEAVIFGDRAIGRTATKGSRVFWTSGSIYCETAPRFLPAGFFEKMLAN